MPRNQKHRYSLAQYQSEYTTPVGRKRANTYEAIEYEGTWTIVSREFAVLLPISAAAAVLEEFDRKVLRRVGCSMATSHHLSVRLCNINARQSEPGVHGRFLLHLPEIERMAS